MFHLLFPAIGILGYLAYPKTLEFHPTYIKGFAIIHNAGLALFSAYTCLQLVRIVAEKPIVFASTYYFSDPRVDTLLFYFYISKYYEFFDTFILYAKKRTPPFLQTFHHIGAVLWWHLSYVYKVDALIWASLLNAAVHTVMYSYYLMSLFKINIGFIKQSITTLQLAQLVTLFCLTLYKYRPPVETVFNYRLIIGFNTYVGCLIFLFLQFMQKTYYSKEKIDPL